MKTTQIVGQNEVSAKNGIIIVLASLLCLYLDSMLVSLLSRMGLPPLFTSIVFWGLGGTIAAIVYYRFVIRYLYTVDGVKMTVERVYHKKPRPLEEMMLRDILFVGAPETATKKYGNIKALRAVRTTNPNPPVAVVYKRAGEKRLLLFQPNKEILAALDKKAE